jgi:hypothetical protein
VNTVLEMAGVDDELSAHASRHLSRIEQQFDATLRDAGCTPQQAHELAQMLMLLNEGVRVASRRRLSVQAQLDPIDATFRLLRGQLQPVPARR